MEQFIKSNRFLYRPHHFRSVSLCSTARSHHFPVNVCAFGVSTSGLSFPALHAAAVATLEVTADSDAGSREKRTRLPTDTFNRTSRLASKRRRCPSSTDSVNLMLRHPSVASFSGVADGQHYVVSHDGSAQSLLSSNAGGATLGQIATQIRFAGSPADSAANASSTMRSCCTHSLLLRELRRCALHLRPATEQYLDVLKQLLSSYVDNIVRQTTFRNLVLMYLLFA